jgi:iron complex transport system substrate-binding protein
VLAAGLGLVSVLFPGPTRAQQATATLTGHVVAGRDSVPVGGQPVMLHEVTGDSGGVADSVRTKPDGSFSFTLMGDTSRTVYLVAVRFDSVLYFGAPIERLAPSEPYTIQVFPARTVESTDTVPVTRRSLVLTYDGDGASVLDAIQFDNNSDTTLVGRGPGGWRIALPEGAQDPEALSGGMFPGGIRFEGGFALLDPSLRPGTSGVLLRYRLPSDRPPRLTAAHPMLRLELLWSGTDRELTGVRFRPAEPVSFHGESYRAVAATFVPAGVELPLAFVGGSSRKAAWFFIVAGLLLGAGAFAAWRWGRGRGPSGTGTGVAGVVLLLALLGPGARDALASDSSFSWAALRDSIRIRDDLGRVVSLAGPPRRIVSLVPAVTEILFALGAGDRVVGRTRYGVHPSEASAVPSVGEGVHPSIESIVSRRPGLVILYAGSDSRATVRELEVAKVAALAVRHDGFPDLYRNVARLGRLTDRRWEARELASQIRCSLSAVAEVTAQSPRRTVYLDVWEDPPYTVGSGSYLDSLIRVAGGSNVFGDLRQASPQVSLEAVAARDPDVVVVSGGPVDRPALDGRPAWRVIPAVASGRVQALDGDLLDRLGPRVGEAAAALAAAIHPDLAANPVLADPGRDCGPANAGRSARRDVRPGGATGRD